MNRVFLLAWLALSSACTTSGLPEVVNVRDVSSAGGPPRINKIIDLGSGLVPKWGPFKPAPADGLAVIGERILIKGNDFGKQPTVNIGGKPTSVLAHIKGGGVVVRVPWGIDPGQVDVQITNARGVNQQPFPIKRRGILVTGQSLFWFEVNADGTVTPGDELPLPGARHIALSVGGAVAYVGGEAPAPTLWTVDMAASAPAVIKQQSLPGTRLIDLVTAEQRTLGAVVTDTHVVYFDTSNAGAPTLFPPRALTQEIKEKKILAAALGGQGRALALLLAELNQVALFNAENAAMDQPEFVDVLPGARLSVVKDLRFSTDGGSLWVASGDNSRSLSSGYQQAQMTMLRLGVAVAGRGATIFKTWDLGHKMAPVELAVARGEPIPPGTSIRAEPSTAAFYLSTASSGLLKRGLDTFLKEEGEDLGQVIRSGLDQSGTHLLAGARLVGAIDVVGKTQILVALACEAAGGVLHRGLLSVRAWQQRDEPHFVRLDKGGKIDTLTGSDLWLGELRVQP